MGDAKTVIIHNLLGFRTSGVTPYHRYAWPHLVPSCIIVWYTCFGLNLQGGYGSPMLNLVRKRSGTLNNGSEFPLTPGRDFSGRVVQTGSSVDSSKFKVGDEVKLLGFYITPKLIYWHFWAFNFLFLYWKFIDKEGNLFSVSCINWAWNWLLIQIIFICSMNA